MKRYIWIIIPLLAATFCAPPPEITIDKEAQVVAVSSKPALTISYETDMVSATNVAGFLADSIMRFSRIARTDTTNINIKLDDKTPDYYRLFFTTGDRYFADYKNTPIIYGILQLEWESILNSRINRNDPVSVMLRRERYNTIRIKDFQNLFARNHINRQDLTKVFPYINLFTLREVLFISVQEIMERPSRYVGTRHIDTIVFNVVIIPEITEFTRFLVRKFGRRRVIRFAREEYSVAGWKKAFGEEINETEAQFADYIEDMEFDGIFKNQSFINEFEELLKLYNTITKDSIFKD
jgi:hypothetical protein